MPTTTWTTAALTANYNVNPDFNRTFAATMGGTAYPTNAPHKVTSATMTYSAVTMWSKGRNFYATAMTAARGYQVGAFTNDGNSNQHAFSASCATGEFAVGGGYNGITAIGAMGNAAGTGTAFSLRAGCVITLTLVWDYTTSSNVNIGGAYRKGTPWANVGGTWRRGTLWVNVGGIWRRGI